MDYHGLEISSMVISITLNIYSWENTIFRSTMVCMFIAAGNRFFNDIHMGRVQRSILVVIQILTDQQYKYYPNEDRVKGWSLDWFQWQKPEVRIQTYQHMGDVTNYWDIGFKSPCEILYFKIAFIKTLGNSYEYGAWIPFKLLTAPSKSNQIL